VNELMAALDHSVGAPFTQTLAALYAYVQQEILKGHAGPSEEALQRAIGILNTLSEGWSGVSAEVSKVKTVAAPPAHYLEFVPPEESQTFSGDRSGGYYQEATVPASSRGWSA
jgi:hypothetical protein